MVGLLVAGAVAMTVALFATPVLIRVLGGAGIRQPIHDAVSQHAAKAGTPTMGDTMVPVGLVLGYAAAHLAIRQRPTTAGLLVVVTVILAACVGALDDWMKVKRERNLGLRERQKTLALLAVIAVFAAVYVRLPTACTRLSFTRCDSLPAELGTAGWVLFAFGVFWLTTNAVNFADGLEGLLAGSGATSFVVLAAIAFWQFRHPQDFAHGSLDLAVVATGLAGACVGFLWWNANPKTIFMGDTGSLAIGAGIAALAMSMEVVLLIPILGALYVAPGLSSFLQRLWFKATRRFLGQPRRLFRMAPLHHHFELGGWAEPTILIRFWLVNAMAATLAGGLFYADALR